MLRFLVQAVGNFPGPWLYGFPPCRLKCRVTTVTHQRPKYQIVPVWYAII